MARAARWSLRLVVAATLVATAGLAMPTASPAAAAGCPTAHGVTVVVDFHELGGGVQAGCVPSGGGNTASQLFPAAGFALTYVQRQPGFVCRVSGRPADNPCVSTPPADAYWGLYWSDGESGRWTYATSGAGGQQVPDGGYVGFSWQGSADSTPPGYSPAAHPSAGPSPTHAPTHAPTNIPPQHGSSAAPSSTPSSDSPGDSPAESHTKSHTKSPSATKSGAARSKRPKPSASPTTEMPTTSATPAESPSVAPASSDPADPGDGGLPGWVAPVVIVVLFVAAGAFAVVRRRQGAA
jgi:hypothetical protein